MKFVHIADMHFDSPYINLSDKSSLGDLRRLEQRKIFSKIINYIKQNDIPFFFIAGDLFEHKYIKKSTIEFINNSFKEVPNTKIFITPGNHDPLLKDSYYNTFTWNDNVKVFSSLIEKVDYENIHIYGFGFDDFVSSRNTELDNIQLNEDDINILLTHATLDGSNSIDNIYNPISKAGLLAKNFNYVALGHIHKRDIIDNKIVYSGSTISHGFDELGEHGMIVGDISSNSNTLEFIKLDTIEFKEIDVDISDISFKEDLIEVINSLNINEDNYIKINLIGDRHFEINTSELLRLTKNINILKIKDNSKIKIDISKYSNENTLRGIFVKNILEDMNNTLLFENNNLNKDILEKALEIGLDALE